MFSKDMITPRHMLRIASLLYGMYFVFANIHDGCTNILDVPGRALICISLLCGAWGLWSGFLLLVAFLMLSDALSSLSLGHTLDFHGRGSPGRLVTRTDEPLLFRITVLAKLLIFFLATGHVLLAARKEKNGQGTRQSGHGE